MKKIKFCSHAKLKLIILKEHGFLVTRKDAIETIKNPDKIEKGREGRLIAQRRIDEEHVLRVVYEKDNGKITVITFYPGRRNYYES